MKSRSVAAELAWTFVLVLFTDPGFRIGTDYDTVTTGKLLEPSAMALNDRRTVFQRRVSAGFGSRQHPVVATRCCVLLLLPTLLSPCSASGLDPSVLPCKYSVRDVAFVNLTDKPWQLRLIKPLDVSDAQFQTWNELLQAKLARTNVGHIWLTADSRQAIDLTDRLEQQEPHLPLMELAGPNEQLITFQYESKTTFADQLQWLLDSPARRLILDQVAQALCVIILVESGNDQQNSEAREKANRAIEQLDRQMWTLEKPTSKGPVLVTISDQQKQTESWLLRSLGIGDDNTPAVAIVYGQGRRLGQVLSGKDITIENIVGRSSICGQNCECDLDRDWLYGQQIIHRWSDKLERVAEQDLTFDPKSAFVIAEVSQIIQKNSSQRGLQQRVNLGGGLLIHDLPEREKDNLATESTDLTTTQNGFYKPPNINAARATTPTTSDTRSGTHTVPWSLVAALLVIAVIVAAWLRINSA